MQGERQPVVRFLFDWRRRCITRRRGRRRARIDRSSAGARRSSEASPQRTARIRSERRLALAPIRLAVRCVRHLFQRPFVAAIAEEAAADAEEIARAPDGGLERFTFEHAIAVREDRRGPFRDPHAARHRMVPVSRRIGRGASPKSGLPTENDAIRAAGRRLCHNRRLRT